MLRGSPSAADKGDGGAVKQVMENTQRHSGTTTWCLMQISNTLLK